MFLLKNNYGQMKIIDERKEKKYLQSKNVRLPFPDMEIDNKNTVTLAVTGQNTNKRNTSLVREATKNVFFSGQSTTAFSPPPPRFSGQKNTYNTQIFFLVNNPLPPPPSQCTVNEEFFFAAFL